MLNWYKIIKEADKESFLISQKPKNLSIEFWTEAVKWAININPKYSVWLARLIANNPKEFRFGEDDNKVKEALRLFEKVKNRPEIEKKDINQYKQYSDLAKAIEPFKDKGGVREEQRKKAEEGVKKIDEIDGYGLYLIKNYDGAHWIAQGTEWCISDQSAYEDYAQNGPIYYFSQGEDPYALYHFASGQFKDIYDDPMRHVSTLPLLKLIDKNKKLLQIDDIEDIDYEHDEKEEDLTVITRAKDSLYSKKMMYENFSEANPPHAYTTLLRVMERNYKNRLFSLDPPVDGETGKEEDDWVLSDFAELGLIKESLPKGLYENLINQYGEFLEQKFQESIASMGRSIMVKEARYWTPQKCSLVIEQFTKVAKQFAALPIDLKNKLYPLVMSQINETINAFIQKLSELGLLETNETITVFSSAFSKLKELKDKKTAKMFRQVIDNGIKDNDINAITAHFLAHKKLRTGLLSKRGFEGWMNVAQHDPITFLGGFPNNVLGYTITPIRLRKDQKDKVEAAGASSVEYYIANNDLDEVAGYIAEGNNAYRIMSNLPIEQGGPNLLALVKRLLEIMPLQKFTNSLGRYSTVSLVEKYDWARELISQQIREIFAKEQGLREIYFELPNLFHNLEPFSTIISEEVFKRIDYKFVKSIILNPSQYDAYYHKWPQYGNHPELKEKIAKLAATIIVRQGREMLNWEIEHATQKSMSWYRKTNDYNKIEIRPLVEQILPDFLQGDPLIERAIGILEVQLRREMPSFVMPTTDKGIKHYDKNKNFIIEMLNSKSIFDSNEGYGENGKLNRFERILSDFDDDEDIKKLIEDKINKEMSAVNEDTIFNVNGYYIARSEELKQFLSDSIQKKCYNAFKQNILQAKPKIDRIFNLIMEQIVSEVMPIEAEAVKANKEVLEAQQMFTDTYRKSVGEYSPGESEQLNQDRKMISDLRARTRELNNNISSRYFGIIENAKKQIDYNVYKDPIDVEEMFSNLRKEYNHLVRINSYSEFHYANLEKEFIDHYASLAKNVYGYNNDRQLGYIVRSLMGQEHKGNSIQFYQPQTNSGGSGFLS